MIGQRLAGAIILVLILCSPLVLRSMPILAANMVEVRVSSVRGSEAALSPDGNEIVFVMMGRLFVGPAAGGKAREIGGLGYASNPSWSADGKRIVCSDGPDGRLYEFGLDGKSRRLSNEAGERPACSPDGRSVAFVRDNRVWILDVDGPTERKIADDIAPGARPQWLKTSGELFYIQGKPESPLQRSIIALDIKQPSPSARKLAEGPLVYQLAFSGDGSRVAVLRFRGDEATAKNRMQAIQIWTTDLSFAALTRVTTVDWLSWQVLGLFPSGGFLVTDDACLLKVSADGNLVQPIHFEATVRLPRPEKSTPAISLVQSGSRQRVKGLAWPRISPDGRRVAFSALGDIWVTDLDNPGAGRWRFDHPGHEMQVSWFPDGRRLAFVSDRGGDYDIWVLDVATGETRRLTSLAGEETSPCISPDGSRIAFSFFDGGEGGAGVDRAQVSIVRSDGAELRHLGRTGPITGTEPIAGWLADGSAVLISIAGASAQGEHLRAMPLGEDKPYDLAEWPNQARRIAWPSVARDRIAFESGEQLWIQDLRDEKPIGEPRLLEDGKGFWASFSADGKKLFYLTPDGPALHDFSGDATRKIDLDLSYEVPRSEALVLSNVRIAGLAEQRFDIRLADSRIAKIYPHEKSRRAPAADVFDLEGRVVIPGLIDGHVHLGHLSYLRKCFLAFGVTTVVDMGAEPLGCLSLREAHDSGELPGPRIIYAGDIVSQPSYVGSIYRPLANEDEARRFIERQHALGARVLKLYAPLRSLVEPLVKMAREKGMYITGENAFPLAAYGGHAAEHTQSEEGISLLRAVGGSMTPTLVTVDTFRGPAHITHAETLRALIERSNWWPAYAKAGLERRMTEKPRAAPGEVNPWIVPVGKAWRSGLSLHAGTDTLGVEAGLALHWELERLVEAGLKPDEALAAATSRIANDFGLSDELGEVKEGYRADLVVLDADPHEDICNTQKIWMVVKDGRIVHRRDTQSRTLQDR